jgi:hypothetical protein
MKKPFIFFSLFFLIVLLYPLYSIPAQETQTNNPDATAQTKPAEVTLPELPPTPRSKLEIIQYILLPFAIGAAIWLILRLEKVEREELKGKE